MKKNIQGTTDYMISGNVEFFRLARRELFFEGGWTLSSCPLQKKRTTQPKRNKSAFPEFFACHAGRCCLYK
jgi:hypothetical protein